MVVPSSQIRSLESPELVTERYDGVVERALVVTGLDGVGDVHQPYDGKIWYVTDRQITIGYGHSGFPIMVLPEWDLAREDAFGDGWGVWHETGHNHQQYSLWSSRFGVEVTCNIFSLDLARIHGGDDDIRAAAGRVVSRLESGPESWDTMTDVFEQLVFFAQAAWAYPDAGFEIYAPVHRAFRELSAEEQMAVRASPDLQVDYLYRFLSTSVGADLHAHFA
jgi:hypothetical protein